MIRKNLPFLIVIITSLALLIFKWSYLSLPTYWDETYPYAYAIHQMADKGITLMPGELPMDVSKGHPLLFHALAATWIRIFGPGMFSIHMFALLIAIALLFAVYTLGKKVHSPAAGAIAAVLLATRTVFLVQSSFLLPEMLIALLTVLVLVAWLNNNKLAYVILGSLLLLTKESGLVLMLFLPLIRFVQMLRMKYKWTVVAAESSLYTVPFFPWLFFLILQHASTGMWFFNEHIHPSIVSNFSFTDIFVKTFCAQMFIYYGGLFSLAATAFLLLLKFSRKTTIEKPLSHKLWLLFGFIAAYLLFCGFTFPIARYLVSALAIWYVIVAVLMLKILRSRQLPSIVVTIILTGVQIGYAYDIRRGGDYDFGYEDAVHVHQQAIDWLVTEHKEHDKIFAQHVFMRCVTDPSSGYVEDAHKFTYVTRNVEDASIFVITSYDEDPTQSQAKRLPLKLEARFEQGATWIELYTR